MKQELNLESNTRKVARRIKAFKPRPERTIEWLGGVNYANLEKFMESAKAMVKDSPGEEVHLLISSYGGPTGVAMAFCDAVAPWLSPNLVTIGSGDVDSSGILLFLAGRKRYLTKNTTMLLHLAGRTFEEGKRYSTADMETMLKEDKLKDYQYACTVADATGGKYSAQDILELMARGTILTPDEAVKMGLAHKVI